MNKDVDLIVRGYNTIINCMLSDSKNLFKPKKQDKTRVQRTQNRTHNRLRSLWSYRSIISIFLYYVRKTLINVDKINFMFDSLRAVKNLAQDVRENR